MATEVRLPSIEPFKAELLEDQKALAVKVLEESAEVFSAYEDYKRFGDIQFVKNHLLYECLDVMQACINLLVSVSDKDPKDIAFEEVYRIVHENNAERGRYDER